MKAFLGAAPKYDFQRLFPPKAVGMILRFPRKGVRMSLRLRYESGKVRSECMDR